MLLIIFPLIGFMCLVGATIKTALDGEWAIFWVMITFSAIVGFIIAHEIRELINDRN